MKLSIILIILALLAIGLRLAVPRLGSSAASGIVERDGKQQLDNCPDTPNCHLDEFNINGDPANAIDTVAAVVSEQKGAQIVNRDGPYLHATFATPLMGFIDDVEFLLRDAQAGEAATLQVRSASRLGQSDLGANSKRVAKLREAVSGRL